MKTGLLYLLALAAALCALGAGLGEVDLAAPDELRDAEIAREMFVGEDAWIPKLNGEPFLENPPLHYWLVGACFRLLGVEPFAARLPSVLAALGTALVLAALLEKGFGFRTALCGFLVLLTTWGFVSRARQSLLDMTLALWVALGIYFLTHSLNRIPQALAFGLAGGIAACAAFYTQGPAGALAIYAAALAWFVWKERERWKQGLALYGASLVPLAAGVAAWTWTLHRRGSAFPEAFWGVGPLAGAPRGSAHAGGPWYYFLSSWEVLLPWSLALPPLAFAALREKRWRSPHVALLLCWFAAPLAVLSLAPAKRSLYLLPLLPAAAGLVAVGLTQWKPKTEWPAWPDLWLRIFAFAAPATGFAAALVAIAGWPSTVRALSGDWPRFFPGGGWAWGTAGAAGAAFGAIAWAIRHSFRAGKPYALPPLLLLSFALALVLLESGPLKERRRAKTFTAFFHQTFPIVSRPDDRRGWGLSEFGRAAIPYHLSRIGLNHTLPMIRTRDELERWILDPATAGRERILFVEDPAWLEIRDDPRLASRLTPFPSPRIRNRRIWILVVR